MKPGAMETARTLLLAIIAVLLCHVFVLQPFWIPSGSMVPTLLVGDYLFVNKFAYGFSRYSLPFAAPLFTGRILSHAPQRGDVVVFVPPGEPDEIFIKRLVGLPGDKIQLWGGQLYINGARVPRMAQGSYMDDSDGGPVLAQKFCEVLPGGRSHAILKVTAAGFANNTPVYTVPAQNYFFMGDNRDNSEDSRFPGGPVGYVPAANLLGPAVFILGSIGWRAPWWAFWDWPGELRWGRFGLAVS